MGDFAYQDDAWVELINGKIIAMSPRPLVSHHLVSLNIARLFGNALQGKSCTAFADGVDVYLTEKDRVIPDAMIVCNKDIIKRNGLHGAPDLVVEVLSRSTEKRDRGYKKDLYERCGVKEYWIVEIMRRSIEVYLLTENDFMLDEVYTLDPEEWLEDMTEEEKSEIVYEFHTSVCPEITVKLKDVFEGMF